jgi:hypothetical protein
LREFVDAAREIHEILMLEHEAEREHVLHSVNTQTICQSFVSCGGDFGGIGV